MTTAASAAKFSEGASRLREVEIFSTGTHRGKTYTVNDLNDIVRNFEKSSRGKDPKLAVPLAVPRLQPGAPAVLGHEEEQKILEGSDLPSAGWPSRVWRDGNVLKADIEEVAPSVADAIRHRRYRTVSAEIYDEPPDGIQGKGKMLRRIAYLGADVPQVKNLKHLPMPEAHAESGARFDRINSNRVVLSLVNATDSGRGYWTCFSEVTQVEPNADELMQKLSQMGISAEALQGCPPAALAEMLRALEDAKNKPADMDEEAKIEKDEGELGEPHNEFDEPMPEDADDEKKKAYSEKARKYMEAGRKMAERCGMKLDDMPGMGQADISKPMNPMGEGAPMPKQTTLTHKYAELKPFIEEAVKEAFAKHAKGTLGELTKFHEEFQASERKKTVDSVCDRLFAEGKLTKPGRARLHAALMGADARTVVEKFSEGGKKVELTQFDQLVRFAEAVRPFTGERLHSASAGNTGSDEEQEEVAKVEKFSETANIARALEVQGKTPADFVEGFKKARKANPKLTAKQYGVPETV